MNNLEKETILIKNIEQLKQTIKDKSYNSYELVEPIMIKGVKCSKPKPKAPRWFTEFANEQRAFNKVVINRLDNVDKRLDKQEEFNKQTSMLIKTVIKLNNLKTE